MRCMSFIACGVYVWVLFLVSAVDHVGRWICDVYQ